MARRTKSADTEVKESGFLVNAAIAIGTAAGHIASIVGATAEGPPVAKSAKKRKLPPKHKTGLPRRQKKTLRKAQSV